MDRSPLVSVIIPVYNVAPYLAESLDSVLHQTYEHLEVIIIDDGSTDGSGEICDSYAAKDGRIRVIHQENRGLSAARNAGLDIMTGEITAFLDSDDAYHISFIEKLLPGIFSEGADLAECSYASCRTTEKMQAERARKKDRETKSEIYDRRNALRALADGTLSMHVWNKLYRRELWQNIRFPEGHVFEDLGTTYRIIDRCRRVYFENSPLYLYRVRAGSIANTGSYRNVSDWISASSRFCSFMESHTPEIFSPEQLNRARVSRLTALISGYLHCPGQMREESVCGEDLRWQIISEWQEIGSGNLGCPLRAACFMIYYCPWLLKIAYPVYARARQFCAR